jgi:hypothetical protein
MLGSIVPSRVSGSLSVDLRSVYRYRPDRPAGVYRPLRDWWGHNAPLDLQGQAGHAVADTDASTKIIDNKLR